MTSPITSSSMIDVQGIVSNLMKVESAPLTALQKDATAITTKISAYGKVSSSIATFRDAANNLAQLSTWKAVTASSSNAAAVAGTGADSGGDRSGSRVSGGVHVGGGGAGAGDGRVCGGAACWDAVRAGCRNWDAAAYFQG